MEDKRTTEVDDMSPDELEAAIAAELGSRETAVGDTGQQTATEAGASALPHDEITFDDCCRLILEDWPSRQDGAKEQNRIHSRRLLTLLTSEFGVEWEDDWRPSVRFQGIPMLLLSMPRMFPRATSPFGSYMEYSPSAEEGAVVRRHRPFLKATEEALRQSWTALFRDLMLLRWPEAAERRTSWSRLKDLGLGEPPASDDDGMF